MTAAASRLFGLAAGGSGPLGRIWAVTGGLALCAALLYVEHIDTLDRLGTSPSLRVWMLAPIFYLAEVGAVHLRSRREAHSFTLTELPFVLGLAFADPGELLAARLLGTFFALGLTPGIRQRPLKLAFNLALAAVETEVGLAVFRAISDGRPLTAAGLTAMFVAAAAAVAVSVSAVSLVVALAEGRPAGRSRWQALGLGAAVAATGTSLGLVGAGLMSHEPALSVLVVLPAAGVLLAYRSHVAARDRTEALQFLYETARLLHAAPDVETAITTLLHRARRLLRAERAELVLLPVEPGDCAFRSSDGSDGTVLMRTCTADELGALRAHVAGSGQGLLIPRGHGAEQLLDLANGRVRDALLAPLRGESRVIGTLAIVNREGDVTAFRPDDLTLLEALASHAASVLENARLGMTLARLTELLAEREDLETQLRQSQKLEAVGRLAGGIAHDFNNLLTVILGSSQLMLESVPDDHPLYGSLDDVREAGERAAALTRQLLAFSRRQVLQPRVVDLSAIVARTETMLRRLIGEHIVVTVELDPVRRRVLVDPPQIEQVLVDLAVNARDAMPRGGLLHVSTSGADLDDDRARPLGLPGGAYVTLTVSDTGCGMDEATRARVFEPFFTTRGPGEGTGLGLATVYGIVTQSGGGIRVTSSPGEGSTFTVYLPSAEPSAGAELPFAAPCRAADGETVLVVEDEEAVRSFVCTVFQAAGYEVLEARDGAEALEVVDGYGERIDLLVSDVVMPGMSGPELVGELAASCPDLRVVYMSGYAHSALGEHAVGGDETRFLQKPFPPQALLEKARELLDAPFPLTELTRGRRREALSAPR